MNEHQREMKGKKKRKRENETQTQFGPPSHNYKIYEGQ